MKRWMLWVGGLVLAAAIAAPWAVGILTEQQWGEATREVNAAQPFLDFTTGHYQRHLFSSELEGQVDLRDPETGAILQIHFRGTVHHGVTGSRLELHPVAGDTAALATLFPDKQPSIVIETHLWGAAEVNVSVPAIELTDKTTGATVSMAASHGRVQTSDAGDHLEMSLRWPGMQVQAPDGRLSVSDLRIDESLDRLQGEVWTGGGHLGLARVTVAPSGRMPIALTNLTLESNVSADPTGERLNSQATVSVEKLAMGDEVSGPYQVAFAVRNASVAAWNELTATLRQIQQEALSATMNPGSGSTAGVNQQQTLQALAGAVRQFVAAGVAIGIPSLTASTPKGRIEGRIMLQHPTLPVAKRDELMLIMQRLTGSANLTVPAGLVASNAPLMNRLRLLLKQGLVTRKGDSFLFSATLKDLALTINGKEIPLPPLI